MWPVAAPAHGNHQCRAVLTPSRNTAGRFGMTPGPEPGACGPGEVIFQNILGRCRGLVTDDSQGLHPRAARPARLDHHAMRHDRGDLGQIGRPDETFLQGGGAGFGRFERGEQIARWRPGAQDRPAFGHRRRQRHNFPFGKQFEPPRLARCLCRPGRGGDQRQRGIVGKAQQRIWPRCAPKDRDRSSRDRGAHGPPPDRSPADRPRRPPPGASEAGGQQDAEGKQNDMSHRVEPCHRMVKIRCPIMKAPPGPDGPEGALREPAGPRRRPLGGSSRKVLSRAPGKGWCGAQPMIVHL